MQQVTPILDNESAIQYQGVKDSSSRTGTYPVVGLMIGTFKRGRFDKPMTITNGNIRAQLGYDPKNPSYIAVQDVLASGVPSVQVLRVEGLAGVPPVVVPPSYNAPPPVGQINASDVNDAGWSILTFDELGSVNPAYTRNNPLVGMVNISTHACFQGQQVAQLNTGAYSLLGSTPTVGQDLSFDLNSGFYAQIKEDNANPDTPVLAGNISYDSPVSVLFSVDVHAIALTGGFFNNIGSTYIEVYDRLGHVLGSAVNTQEGIETFGFSIGNEAKIAGFSFYVNDAEDSGFALDNLKFK